MTIDLSLDKNNDYAVYVPAISSSYCHWASQWEKKLYQTDAEGKLKYPNRNPKKISKDAKELYFLNPENGCFHYNAALYSAGHAQINDLNESKYIESVIHSRDRKKTTIVADSGGFQIATGASGSSVANFDWANPLSKDNDKIRLSILRWMESVADYSMMLDIPTHSIGNPKTSIKSFRDCLDMTKYNADFFVKNRIPGATKILNTLQGRYEEEAEIWWNEVKDYPFEGWAVGGVSVRNLDLLIRRLIIMRDGNYIGADREWMHVLGTSRLSTACVLTEIQRAIRKTVYPKFTISFDSATPFVVAAKGFAYTQNAFAGGGNGRKKRFSYLTEKMIECVDAVGSDRPFPFTSAPGRFMTVGDICTRDPAISKTKTTWDSFSYVLLMWHNLYRQIDAVQEALRIYDMPTEPIRPFIPPDVLEFKEICSEIFTSENAIDTINKNKTLLQSVSGVKVKQQDAVFSELFGYSEEDGGMMIDEGDYEDPSEGRETDLVDIENL